MYYNDKGMVLGYHERNGRPPLTSSWVHLPIIILALSILLVLICLESTHGILVQSCIIFPFLVLFTPSLSPALSSLVSDSSAVTA